MNTLITPVQLEVPDHVTALLNLLDEYSAGPTGGGAALPAQVRERLPGLLRAQPHYRGLLAWVDLRPVGLVNAFFGVSTFRAQPLLNIHDIVVATAYRRQGIARMLLERIEAEARRAGCCKMTLEVLEGNAAALEVYRQRGFERYALDPAMGGALFLQKNLS
jgi:ribosomal protein S18 acetylase RimI-like enzyme